MQRNEHGSASVRQTTRQRRCCYTAPLRDGPIGDRRVDGAPPAASVDVVYTGKPIGQQKRAGGPAWGVNVSGGYFHR
jgi:hypothetical protein